MMKKGDEMSYKKLYKLIDNECLFCGDQMEDESQRSVGLCLNCMCEMSEEELDKFDLTDF